MRLEAMRWEFRGERSEDYEFVRTQDTFWATTAATNENFEYLSQNQGFIEEGFCNRE